MKVLTKRQIQMIESEAARFRAMSKCESDLKSTWIEMAETMELAVEILKEVRAVQNACR